MKKQPVGSRRKKADGKPSRPKKATRKRVTSRPKSRSLTRLDAPLAKRPTSNARDQGSSSPIDPLTGDLPAVTLKDFHEVLRHFERVDPRLAEAWKRDVVVHEGPITLRRVMSPANFGGATHYAYVDRRLLWYLKRDSATSVGARWEGYLACASDAPPDTMTVFVGRDILVRKCSPQLEEGSQLKQLEEVIEVELDLPRGAR